MNPLQQALALKTELDALRPIAPELEARAMQKLRLDWNYHSNHLEGNSLNYGETKALLLFGITAQGKPLKDHFEITGHNEAIDWVLDVVKGDMPLTEAFIRQLHVLLLKAPYDKKTKNAAGLPTSKTIQVGQYKTTDNHVETVTGEMFYFASALETPAKMADLIAWYAAQQARADVNPILLAAEFHYRFIRIHPFDDGNGRTARILMNFILMRFDYPPAVIKTEDKENYFAVLQQADAGLLEPFVDYIAQNVNRSLSLMLAGAKGENIEEPDDLDKELALLEQKISNNFTFVEQTRTDKRIKNTCLQSVAKLIEVFEEECKKFSKFYGNSCLNCYSQYLNPEELTIFEKLSGKVSPKFISQEFDKNDGLKSIRFFEVVSVKLVYVFEIFKYKEIDFDSFKSEIKIDFKSKAYNIFYENHRLQKNYSEQLSNEEITDLVSIVCKNHLAKIKLRIENHEQIVQEKAAQNSLE